MMTTIDDHIVRIAKTARHKIHRHAAIVYRGGSIISIGVNHDRTHAEVQALKNLWPSERRHTKVLVIRLMRSGRVGCSKPCKHCEEYMRQVGVKSVTYSNNEGQLESFRL